MSLYASVLMLASVQSAVAPSEMIAEDAVPTPQVNQDGLEAFVSQWLAPQQRSLERPIISAFEEQDNAKSLKKIGSLLTALPKASPVHIMLETKRAGNLVGLGRIDEGVAIFSRLTAAYPDAPPVIMAGVQSLAYTASAELAARWWIELAARFPTAAKQIDGYTLSSTVGNLKSTGKDALSDALYISLERIGYDPGSTRESNRMQTALFANAARDIGRDLEANTALAKITDPSGLITIATNNTYQRFWDRIDVSQDALAELSRRELADLSTDFIRAQDGLFAGQFLGGSTGSTDPQAVVDAYVPVFERLMKQKSTSQYAAYDAQFWVASLANAFTLAGKPDEGEKLLRQALSTYADTNGSIRLNISANYAVFLINAGRAEEAIEMIEPSIAFLTPLENALKALAQMHAVRLRAYHMAGRASEAANSRALLQSAQGTSLEIYCDTMLAVDDYAAARQCILDGLYAADPEPAIAYLQYPLAANRLQMTKDLDAGKTRLREDSDVKAALNRVGRILPVSPIMVMGIDHEAISAKFQESYAAAN